MMMRISDATLLALSRKLATRFPYSAYTIFTQGKKLADENGYELIIELEKPLAKRISEMMISGVE